jgi:hypothetical protein
MPTRAWSLFQPSLRWDPTIISPVSPGTRLSTRGTGVSTGENYPMNFVSASTLCEDKVFHRANPPSDFFLVFVLRTSTCVDTAVPSWTTVSIVVY